MIEVRLFATFRDGRDKILFLDAENHKNVHSILKALNIPVEEVAILLVNGRHNPPEREVKSGDVVALFPPVGGG